MRRQVTGSPSSVRPPLSRIVLATRLITTKTLDIRISESPKMTRKRKMDWTKVRSLFSPRVLSLTLALTPTVLIPSDENPVIDDVCSTLIHLSSSCPLTGFQELRKILVPLPVGCFLLVRSSLFYVACQIPLCLLFQAILDTCHSGTMLDLPHHHCNNVYVPWQSKGERRTMSMQNYNGSSLHHTALSYTDFRLVRHQATDFADATHGVSLSIVNMIEGQQPAGQPSDGPSQIDGERGRSQERMLFESEMRYASPEPVFHCDGWCDYSDVQHPSVVSIGVTRRNALISRLLVALAVCVFGPAARMGRPKGLADHGLVQLP